MQERHIINIIVILLFLEVADHYENYEFELLFYKKKSIRDDHLPSFISVVTNTRNRNKNVESCIKENQTAIVQENIFSALDFKVMLLCCVI